MHGGRKVIDVHGHISTPAQFRAFMANLIALRSPGDDELEIPDALMQTALDRHLKVMDERDIDVQLISPRPVAMMHWERPFLQRKWARTTNDVIAQQCRMHPTRFAGVAQLPQSRELDTSNCLEELERCAALGFVGAILNPDPAGDGQTPGVHEPYWYPLYERAQALKITLVVHPSISKDPRLEIVPHGYQFNNLAEETLATLLYENGDVFDRFPELKIVVCHCGGALRRLLEIGGRAAGGVVGETGQRAGGSIDVQVRRAKAKRRDTSANLFFDACAYDKDFLATAIKQRGPEQMLFGSEAPGSGTAQKNPETGRPADDLVPVIDSIEFLTAADKRAIFADNARRVFPLLRVDG